MIEHAEVSPSDLGSGWRRRAVGCARLFAVHDGMALRPVADDQWSIVAWLWQVFRYDLALIVDGYPYADGRYQTAPLAPFPSPDRAGYLVWRPHPNTGEDAPVAFALVDGLRGAGGSVGGFWVAEQRRRTGLGRWMALEVLALHPGAWSIGFQHENRPARRFWPAVADAAFGPEGWTEREQAVPGRPHLPPDHVIHSGG